MTVIRPNSISGVSSITGSGGDISIFRADGTAADLIVNNVTTGIVTATSFVGNVTGAVTGSGANLTSIPAGQLTGTVADARLSTVSSSKLSGALPALDGSALTGVGVGTADSINTSGIITATAFVSDTPLSNRNIIVNGAMRVAQRASSSTTSGYGDIDRWKHEYAGTNENPTFAQVSLTPSDTPYTLGLTKAVKITNGNQTSGLQAASQINFNQQIEAQNIRNSGWNYKSSSSYITLSFWVRSSVSQNFNGFVKTADGSMYIYPYETGTLSANTWTKITKSIPGNSNLQIDDDNGTGLQVFAIAIYGTNLTDNSVTYNQWAGWSSGGRSKDQANSWFTTNDATLEITGVQLEVGPVATPFEHCSFGDELARCQRYYYMHHNTSKTGTEGNYRVACLGFVSGSNEVTGHIFFPVTMRANPSIDHNYGVTGGIGYWRIGGGSLGGDKYVDGAWTLASPTTRSTRIYATPRVSLSGGVAGYIDGRNSASYMAFNSEL